MKRWKWFWLLLLVPATVAFAQTWDDIWNQSQQLNKVTEARADLQGCTDQMLQTIDKVQALKDSGIFDLVPADKKATLNAWLQAFKDCKATLLANPGIVEAYQWAP